MNARAVPILPALSITETRDFYVKAGFQVRFFDDAHYGYLIVERDGIELQFFRHNTLNPLTNDHGAYVRCDEVDAVPEIFAPLGLPDHGVPRFTAPEDRPWRMREAYLVDLNGNLLRFGQPIG
ncbi:VOC family protein [bacterium]|nr:VOC family protein [bacterium]